MLQIHNSLTGRKEPFQPLEPGKVGMYVCGVTVYDYCHLGHARMLIVFDVVRRHLVASGYDVVFVRNITDIDDKIIQRAQQNGEPMEALTGGSSPRITRIAQRSASRAPTASRAPPNSCRRSWPWCSA